MLKSQARTIYLEKRKNISSEEKSKLDDAILTEFKKLDFSLVKCIHLFLPILQKQEFNTIILLDFIRTTYPHIEIVIPKTNMENETMEGVRFTTPSDLVKNKWGILEPISHETIDPQMIDLMIIPLLAFDQQGNRVGYGKGFYDRYLTKCKKDMIKIGISYFEPVMAFTDCNEHDQKLTMCISPIQNYFFGI